MSYNLRIRKKAIITDFSTNPNDSEIENVSETESEQEIIIDQRSSSTSTSDDENLSAINRTNKLL